MKKKIVIITHEYYPVLCGGTILVDKISIALVKLRYNVEILTCGINKNFKKTEEKNGVKIARFFTARKSIGDAHLSEHLLFFLLGLPQMFFYLLNRKPDFIFSIFVLPSGLIGLIVSKIFNIRSFVFVDAADLPGLKSAMSNWIKKLIFLFKLVVNYSDGVVVLEGLEDIALPLIKNKNVAIIPHGASLPNQIARPGTENKKLEFLTIGRLVPRKGFLDIIKALAIVKKERNDFHLNVVGYGKIENEIKRVITKNSLSRNITLTGRVEYKDLAKYYLQSDCYLFYGEREGLSLAMIEALAYGLPIIATDHPGNQTFVKHNLNGRLVPEKRTGKLSEAIKYILRNRNELIKMGKNSRSIAEKYSWDKIADEHDVFFKKCSKHF